MNVLFGSSFEVSSSPTAEAQLTPTQLKREIRRIDCGENGLAQKLGVRRAEVRDWLAGENAVPEVVASDIRRMPSSGRRATRQG